MLNANISANAYTGDVTGDGEVTAVDLLVTKKYILGMIDDDIDINSADCFADGNIDARDFLRMKRCVLTMISEDELFLEGSNTKVIINADFTFDIDDKEITLSELYKCQKDSDGDFIVPIGVEVVNNTGYNIDSFQLALNTDLSLYAEDGGIFANIGVKGDTYDTNAIDISTDTKRLLYADAKGIKEKDGTAFTIYVIIPADADTGDMYPIVFNTEYNNACYDSDGTAINLTSNQLIDGYVEVLPVEETTTTTVITTTTEEHTIEETTVDPRLTEHTEPVLTTTEPKVTEPLITTATTEDYSKYTFDVNHDGVENVVDLILLKKRLLGMI
jgi:hypothetical protein